MAPQEDHMTQEAEEEYDYEDTTTEDEVASASDEDVMMLEGCPNNSSSRNRKNKRKRGEAVVVVDPLSSGALLAHMLTERGYGVIAVYSKELPERLMNLVPKTVEGGKINYLEAIVHKGDLDETLSKLREASLSRKMPIVKFFVGCEAGVELFDQLCFRLDVAERNDMAYSKARRNKYLMGERVRECGLRAVGQQLCHSWEEIQTFGTPILGAGRRIVLKPVDSAGSDGVYLCDTVEAAREAYDKIMGSENVFGDANLSVLAQEFLKGKEFVVDTCSYEGRHVVCAFWEYDKRATNGAPFVYYGMHLFESEEKRQGRVKESKEQRLADYVFGVLDALGIRNGPAHAEVMWLEEEDRPCLVEIGARTHGGEGTFVQLTEQAVGYNQISLMLASLDGPQALLDLPAVPRTFEGHASEVILVSHQEGRLLGYRDGKKEIEQMPSFLYHELHKGVGDEMTLTKDLMDTPGSVMLRHRERAVVRADFERVHQIAQSNLFHVKTAE